MTATTVRIDVCTSQATAVFDRALAAAGRVLTGRAPVTSPQERTAVITTVAAALRGRLAEAGALESMLRHCCCGADSRATVYEVMRRTLTALVPEAGFVCPRCGVANEDSTWSRVGVCSSCEDVTGVW